MRALWSGGQIFALITCLKKLNVSGAFPLLTVSIYGGGGMGSTHTVDHEVSKPYPKDPVILKILRSY